MMAWAVRTVALKHEGYHSPATPPVPPPPHKVEHVEGVRLVQLAGGSPFLTKAVTKAADIRKPNIVLIH